MTTSNIIDDELLELVKERLARHIADRDRLDLEISQLTERRSRTERLVADLEDIVAMADHQSEEVPKEAGPTRQSPSARPPRQHAPATNGSPSGRKATADDVVELLKREGPMHYRDIHDAIKSQGLEIGGKGNADTLLSRYFQDSRLERIARGTYAPKDQGEQDDYRERQTRRTH